MNERDFEHRLKRDFLSIAEPRVWCKVPGTRFKLGLPDVTAATPRGAALLELKWLRGEEPGMGVCSLWQKLTTGPQKAALRELARVNGPLQSRLVLGWANAAGQLFMLSATADLAPGLTQTPAYLMSLDRVTTRLAMGAVWWGPVLPPLVASNLGLEQP